MATLAGHGRGDHEQSGHTDQEANESIGECIGQVLCDFDAVGKVERLAGMSRRIRHIESVRSQALPVGKPATGRGVLAGPHMQAAAIELRGVCPGTAADIGDGSRIRRERE